MYAYLLEGKFLLSAVWEKSIFITTSSIFSLLSCLLQISTILSENFDNIGEEICLWCSYCYVFDIIVYRCSSWGNVFLSV